MIRRALAVKKVTSRRARVAVVWAGIIPYFSEREAVDLLGKNDRRIAKGPDCCYKAPPLSFFASAPVPYCWPGHTKHDYRYSIGELEPDIIIERWYDVESVQDILRQRYGFARLDGETVLVKKDSTKVHLIVDPFPP